LHIFQGCLIGLHKNKGDSYQSGHAEDCSPANACKVFATKVFELLKTDKGKQIIRSGWKGAGIIKAVHDARNINTAADLADPFSRL